MSEQAEPQSQPQAAVMPPFNWTVGLTPDGRVVAVQFQTPYGITAFPSDPDAALKFGEAVVDNAKQAKSGIVIASNGAVPKLLRPGQ